jgi:hypothetical protein
MKALVAQSLAKRRRKGCRWAAYESVSKKKQGYNDNVKGEKEKLTNVQT